MRWRNVEDSHEFTVTVNFTRTGEHNPANFRGHPDDWTPADSEDERIVTAVLIDGQKVPDGSFAKMLAEHFGGLVDELDLPDPD